jgi:hypothetical protein
MNRLWSFAFVAGPATFQRKSYYSLSLSFIMSGQITAVSAGRFVVVVVVVVVPPPALLLIMDLILGWLADWLSNNRQRPHSRAEKNDNANQLFHF